MLSPFIKPGQVESASWRKLARYVWFEQLLYLSHHLVHQEELGYELV